MTPNTERSPIETLRLSSTTEAARLIVSGKLVAFPTETVYGLGVDARNADAVQRLFLAKGRPADNPLIVHLDNIDRWHVAARELTQSAATFLDAFSPGPLTVVLPKQTDIDPLVTAGLDSVGIRIPAHAIARDLLAQASIPVAAPSANRSGRPSCTTWQAVIEDMDGRIDGVLMGDASDIGVESTVVDCCGDYPILLRPGGVTLQQLRSVVSDTVTLEDHLKRLEKREHAGPQASNAVEPLLPSPGLRHPHYQPRARILLVDDAAQMLTDGALENAHAGKRTAFVGLRSHAAITKELELQLQQRFCLITLFEDVAQYAAGFYESLRECDRNQVELIVVQRSPDTGVGEALAERQRRACG